MVIWKSKPQIRIVTSYGGSNYTFTNDQLMSCQIRRLENGFDTATIWLNDWQSCNWLATTDTDKTIVISLKDSSDASWTEVFNGIVRFVTLPISKDGEFIELKCDGKGYGFGETICFSEFGSESSKPTLNTMRLILNTPIIGIVDGYVNNMFTDNLTDTGFGYTSNSTTCQDISGVIKYLYFPGVPNTKAIKDLFDLVQAIKGATAGPHWIVDVNGNLLVCTVNADHPDAANNGWYKYYGNSLANATLTQGTDFVESHFEKLAKEANYVLYHGACTCPSGGDYAENNSTLWDQGGDVTLSDDSTAGYFKVGGYSLKVATVRNNGVGVAFWYPKTGYLSLNLSKLSGSKSAPQFSFYVRRNTEINHFGFIIWQDFAGAGDWADSGNLLSNITVDKWTFMNFDLGNKWMENTLGAPTESTGMTWVDVDRIHFILGQAANANNKYIWLDGVNFSGAVLRGARQTTAYSSTDPMKVKVIHDNIAKGDSLVAADDSGTIARMAYAELLRCKGTPIVGWVKTPYIKDLLPGQILHINAKQKADTSYNIDSNMRVTQIVHDINPNGFTSTISLTDDVTNSYARTRFTDFNLVSKASREYEDRQTISAKLGEIDITQAILQNSYQIRKETEHLLFAEYGVCYRES